MSDVAVSPADAPTVVEHPSLTIVREQLERERRHLVEAQRQVAQLRQGLSTQRQIHDAPGNDLWDLSDARMRKKGLWDLYLQSTVLGSMVDAIANRFISGTWSIAPLKDVAGVSGLSYKGTPGDQLMLAEFFSWCNESEDFKMLLKGMVKDYLIFGETYLEVVPKMGIPYELYSCNAINMDFIRDGFGGVKWYTYAQPGQATRPKRFAPEWIIRIWEPSRDDVQRAFSAVEGMVNPLYSDTMMVRTQQSTFSNMGSAAQVVYELPETSSVEDARAHREYVEEETTGVLNARRERYAFGGTKVSALNLKGLDADFLAGRKEARYEAMGRMQVPPNIISYIESGNLGGGTGESQERNFAQNVLEPIKHRFCETLTSRLIVQMFGVQGWVLDVAFADAIGDPYQEKLKTQGEKRAAQGLPKRDIPSDEWTILEVESHVHAEADVEPGTDPAATGQQQGGQQKAQTDKNAQKGQPAKGATAKATGTESNGGPALVEHLHGYADPRPGHAAIARVQAAYNALADDDGALWAAVEG